MILRVWLCRILLRFVSVDVVQPNWRITHRSSRSLEAVDMICDMRSPLACIEISSRDISPLWRTPLTEHHLTRENPFSKGSSRGLSGNQPRGTRRESLMNSLMQLKKTSTSSSSKQMSVLPSAKLAGQCVAPFWGSTATRFTRSDARVAESAPPTPTPPTVLAAYLPSCTILLSLTAPSLWFSCLFQS